MVITEYYAYVIYVSVKAHFTSNFDISKYGMVDTKKVSYNKFLEYNGRDFCSILAKKIKNKKDLCDLFIASFMTDTTLWVGDIVHDLSHYIEKRDVWRARIANMPYTFKADCYRLISNGMKFDSALGQFILKQYNKNNIELETFIIFKKIFNFNLDSDPNFVYIYQNRHGKYESLIDIDVNMYKGILKEALESY